LRVLGVLSLMSNNEERRHILSASYSHYKTSLFKNILFENIYNRFKPEESS